MVNNHKFSSRYNIIPYLLTGLSLVFAQQAFANCDVRLYITNNITSNPYSEDASAMDVKIRKVKLRADKESYKKIASPHKYIAPNEVFKAKGIIGWDYCYEVDVTMKVNYRCQDDGSNSAPIITKTHRFNAGKNGTTLTKYAANINSCKDLSDSVTWSRN